MNPAINLLSGFKRVKSEEGIDADTFIAQVRPRKLFRMALAGGTPHRNLEEH